MTANHRARKKRIDTLLVEQGLVPTRQIAQSLILRGDVLVDDVVVDKAGSAVSPESTIRIRGELSRFVGRGGDKIDPIFELFQVQLSDRVAIDIGASTGGFTDAMLQRGARRVYAVDVGHNQLAEKLRRDPRVVVLENTHARSLDPTQFDPLPDFATIDVSFISVRKILPAIISVLRPPWEMVLLVKPQFELGREFVASGGVVRNTEHIEQSVTLVREYLESEGVTVMGSEPSPLTGAKKGNQEYFLYVRS